MHKELLNSKEAAQYLGISLYYLRNMRHDQHNHEGPQYIVGKHSRGIAYFYSKEALDLWNKQHKWRKGRK